MVHTSTKENETYNLRGHNNARAVKSSTVLIFEDPKLKSREALREPRDDKNEYKEW